MPFQWSLVRGPNGYYGSGAEPPEFLIHNSLRTNQFSQGFVLESVSKSFTVVHHVYFFERTLGVARLVRIPDSFVPMHIMFKVS